MLVLPGGCRYVEWSLHEPTPNQFDLSGEMNLLHFIQLAEEEGLLVNLRVGPYICAERDMVSGGAGDAGLARGAVPGVPGECEGAIGEWRQLV